MEESGLLRVEPKEPTEVPAVLTLVKKDCEGEACRRELEEELDWDWRLGREWDWRLGREWDWRLARRAAKPPLEGS